MRVGEYSVLSFNDEIIEANIYYDGEDFYYIDDAGDIITVYEWNQEDYTYAI